MVLNIVVGIIATRRLYCVHVTDKKESDYFICAMVFILLLEGHMILTLKHRETHGCVVSTVATDALVLKHQAISILSTD